MLKSAIALGVCVLGLHFGEMSFGSEVGELSIRSVFPLESKQRTQLKKIVNEEGEVAKLFEEKSNQAQKLLSKEPSPVSVIYYEGMVNTNPKRIETVKHLQDMDDAALLLEVWQVNGNGMISEKIKTYITAWASTYRPIGNDVNENKLYPLLVGYLTLRTEFSDDERKTIDTWVREMGELHLNAIRSEKITFNNRFTKRLRLIMIMGMILDQAEWREASNEGFKRFVERSLFPDGTSFDLKERDTLTYHASALKPLVDLASLALQNGIDLYRWQSQKGSSVEKSVAFLLPYARGEKKHEEWVNSKVALDRERAEAGLAEYQPGQLYDPKKSLELLEKVEVFEPSIIETIANLKDIPNVKYLSWQLVINQAIRSSAVSKN
ncbi:MAG: alginate lyase family protein [Verrucomicrobiota bacterium]